MTSGIFGKHKHNFEAEIEIFPLGDTTRSTHPFNGIRWDLRYAEDDDRPGDEKFQIYMVWPEFLDDDGNSIPHGVPLIGTYRALMHIVVEEMIDVHRQRVTVGTEFFCTEGRRKVAKGVVTSLSPMNDAGKD